MNPKISIVTATWNCFSTIEECILSLVGQTWENYEHIIIDGDSKDGTLDVIKKYGDLIDICISEPDNGIYDALNKGIINSSGDIIGFLHSDDYFHDKYVLAKIAKSFSDPLVCAVYGDLAYVMKNDTNKILRKWIAGDFKFGDLRNGWMPPHPTLYVRRDWFINIGLFDLRYKISADYHSILKMFGNEKFNSVYVPEVLVCMRTGGESNKSIGNLIIKTKEDFMALRSAGFGAYESILILCKKNIRKIPQFFMK